MSSSSSSMQNGKHYDENNALSLARSVAMAFHPSCSFSTSYQRNNKSNGQKNLRCFPGHCFEGHRSGWCGHPLIVRCKGGSANLRLVGAFSPRSEEETSTHQSPKFSFGQMITRQDLEDRLRSGLLAECMEGYVEEVPRECDVARQHWENLNGRSAPPQGCDREFVFNSKSKGWHYGFLGSKKDSNVWHLWSVYALEPVSPDGEMYRVVTRLDSPPFQLFCRRRNRGPLAKARLEASQRILAVDCRCVYPDSTADELAAAASLPAIPDPTAAKEKKKRRTTADSENSSLEAPRVSAKKQKSISSPRSLLGQAQTTSADILASSAVLGGMSSSRNSMGGVMGSPSLSSLLSSGSSTAAAAAAVAALAQKPIKSTAASMMTRSSSGPRPSDSEPDKRWDMLLDLVKRVQLPGASTPSGGIAAAARRAAHSSLVLIPGQEAEEFGELVLKLAHHWRRMDQLGVPPPVHHSQQIALHTPPDDLAPPFASFLLGQPDFAEQVLQMAGWTDNQAESMRMQAPRATERMLWLMQRQVLAVQRLRSEMRMMNPPASWTSMVTAPTPGSPIPATTPQFPLSLQQELLPSSPLLGFSGIPMTPYLMNQIHRRRMGSNTSTGSDPSMMMTDFDLEWFSKNLDGVVHADGGAPSL